MATNNTAAETATLTPYERARYILECLLIESSDSESDYLKEKLAKVHKIKSTSIYY